MNGQSDRSLSIASGIIGSIALLADVLGIFLFIREFVVGEQAITTSVLLTRLLITIAIFIFGVALITFARNSLSGLDKITAFFAWVYVSLSAFLLGGISYEFILSGNYGLSEYVGLLVLVTLIALLGAMVGGIAHYNTSYFAVPFMLAALLQAILWIYMIFSGNLIAFDLIFIGNVFLLAFAGLFVLVFLTVDWASLSSEMGFTFIVVGAVILVLLLGIVLIASGWLWGAALVAGSIVVLILIWWISD